MSGREERRGREGGRERKREREREREREGAARGERWEIKKKHMQIVQSAGRYRPRILSIRICHRQTDLGITHKHM